MTLSRATSSGDLAPEPGHQAGVDGISTTTTRTDGRATSMALPRSPPEVTIPEQRTSRTRLFAGGRGRAGQKRQQGLVGGTTAVRTWRVVPAFVGAR